jgi:hypothetical protein
LVVVTVAIIVTMITVMVAVMVKIVACGDEGHGVVMMVGV